MPDFSLISGIVDNVLNNAAAAMAKTYIPPRCSELFTQDVMWLLWITREAGFWHLDRRSLYPMNPRGKRNLAYLSFIAANQH